MTRIITGSTIALMLSAPALAAACEISCAFASSWADCHSLQTEARGSAPPGMKMSGMSMAGMAMPELPSAGSANERSVSSMSDGMATHAKLVEMSTCERQSCDDLQALASRENYPISTARDATWLVAGFPHFNNHHSVLHDARDDIAHIYPEIHGPANVSLRI